MTDFATDFEVFCSFQFIFKLLESMATLVLFVFNLVPHAGNQLGSGAGIVIQGLFGTELEPFKIKFSSLDLAFHIAISCAFRSSVTFALMVTGTFTIILSMVCHL